MGGASGSVRENAYAYKYVHVNVRIDLEENTSECKHMRICM